MNKAAENLFYKKKFIEFGVNFVNKKSVFCQKILHFKCSVFLYQRSSDQSCCSSVSRSQLREFVSDLSWCAWAYSTERRSRGRPGALWRDSADLGIHVSEVRQSQSAVIDAWKWKDDSYTLVNV